MYRSKTLVIIEQRKLCHQRASAWNQKIRELVKVKIQLRKWKINPGEWACVDHKVTNKQLYCNCWRLCMILNLILHSHTHTHSVHLLLVNQFGGIHKVLAIKQYGGSCNGAGCPPEHHVCQSLRPRIAWKTKDFSNSRTQLKLLWAFACL